MFQYNGPEDARQNAQRLIAFFGLSAIPEGAHRLRLESLQSEGSPFGAVTSGSEAIYALLADETVELETQVRASLVEALGHLTRAAIEWRAAGKTDRWVELQTWAFAVHNGDELPEAPAVDEGLIPVVVLEPPPEVPDPEPG